MEFTIYELYKFIVGLILSVALMLVIPCLLLGVCYLIYRRRFTRVHKQGGEND